MRHHAIYLLAAGAIVAGVALYQSGAACPRPRQTVVYAATQGQPGVQGEAGKQKESDKKRDPATEAVLENVRKFTEAFNKQDVMTLLKLFADDCVLTEADGTTVRGLKELEKELKDTFEDDPNGKISVSVDFLRAVAPDVVIEEGKTTYFPDGKTLTAETDYQATHVKRGDRWVMTRVRSFNRVVLSPYDQLRDLEWLVGDWVDEASDSLIETSYRWDANKVFLLQDFKIRVKGDAVLSGTQRIGRDPLTKHIKGWVFDSDGGYSESLWTEVNGTWVIKAKGVRADGSVVTMTNEITQLGKDRMSFQSLDRIVDDERRQNMSVVVVRKPPSFKK